MQKHKILAFLLALVVSVCLWFYAVTVVNPDDSTTISGIPVQFEGMDALTARGLMLLAAVLNPAFSHHGATVLAYFPTGNPLTLESITGGAFRVRL